MLGKEQSDINEVEFREKQQWVQVQIKVKSLCLTKYHSMKTYPLLI
jgi:hypothetical protein